MNSPTTLAEHPEVLDALIESATAMLRELTQYESWPEQMGPADGIALTEDGPRITAQLKLLRHHPGELRLELAEPSALKLAQRYLPPETPLAADLIDDTVGEFANVIAGQAKTMLKGTLFHFSLSTPVVTRVPAQAEKEKEKVLGGDQPADQVAMLIGFEEGQMRLALTLTAEQGS
ncbi:MAG: chemotaxis protein CheX [Planctomycetota bacterium]